MRNDAPRLTSQLEAFLCKHIVMGAVLIAISFRYSLVDACCCGHTRTAVDGGREHGMIYANAGTSTTVVSPDQLTVFLSTGRTRAFSTTSYH